MGEGDLASPVYIAQLLSRNSLTKLELDEMHIYLATTMSDVSFNGINTIDDCKFRFIPGKSIIDAIYIIRQLQKKYCEKSQFFFSHAVPIGILEGLGWWSQAISDTSNFVIGSLDE